MGGAAWVDANLELYVEDIKLAAVRRLNFSRRPVPCLCRGMAEWKFAGFLPVHVTLDVRITISVG